MNLHPRLANGVGKASSSELGFNKDLIASSFHLLNL